MCLLGWRLAPLPRVPHSIHSTPGCTHGTLTLRTAAPPDLGGDSATMQRAAEPEDAGAEQGLRGDDVSVEY